MEQRYFRAGVGTVIYNERGEVAFFRRSKYPIGVWQFQQGGIDIGETVEIALWRELQEEVGLGKAHFEAIDQYPTWLAYADPNALMNNYKDRMGQTHQWFFLKLNKGMKIDVKRASDREFDDMKWMSFEAAIAETDNFKKPVYEALFDYYERYIKD
jgi:putative (di)nucleoside polyphosphate hydrolase